MKPAAGLSATVVRHVGSETAASRDVLASEEPLEIRLGFKKGEKREHRAIALTMRTPGDDRELAAGFLFTEGIIRSSAQIEQIRHCGPKRDLVSRRTEQADPT